jgi:putative PIN family toxin of toxin-antitoxin system
MRVVLDANQYMNAVLKPSSKLAQVVQLALKKRVMLLASEPILEEIERVLSYPKLKKLHQFTGQEIGQYIQDIREAATMIPGILKIQAVKADPMDDKYLVCAVEGKADFIVSGDQHLRGLKVFQGIRIVDPATFLQKLE